MQRVLKVDISTLTNETRTPAHFHQGQGIARQQAVCRAAVYFRINSKTLALIGRVHVVE